MDNISSGDHLSDEQTHPCADHDPFPGDNTAEECGHGGPIADMDQPQGVTRFQTLYNYSPISIWEEDFSALKTYLARLGFVSADDLRAYFYKNPQEITACMEQIKVIDVNESTLRFWGHENKSSVIGSLQISNQTINFNSFIEELVAIYENRLTYMTENQMVTSAKGNMLYVNIYWRVVPGHEDDWSQVIVSAVDNTRQITAENSLRESEERLRMIVESAEDVISLQNVTGKYLYYNSNPLFNELFVDVIGKYPEELMDHEDAATLMIHLRMVTDTKNSVRYETKKTRNNLTFWYSNVMYPVIANKLEVVGVGTIARNITKQKQTEMELNRTQKALSTRIAELEKRNLEISLLSEMLTTLQYCNNQDEAFSVINQFMGQIFTEISSALTTLDPQSEMQTYINQWGALKTGTQNFRSDACLAIRTGKPHFVADTQSAPICDHLKLTDISSAYCIPYLVDGLPAGCLTLVSPAGSGEITESDRRVAIAFVEQIGLALTNISLRHHLREQAIHDPLTGLYNRLYLDETFDRELYRQGRNGQPLSVIMIDLDHLKETNDLYGHPAGDAILRELGHLLKMSVRASDIPCRFGGDEFILILPDTPLESAAKRAEMIAEQFRSLSIPFGTQTLGGFTLSIGVACSTMHGHTSLDLIKSVDEALYQAKHAGRDRVIQAEIPVPDEEPDNVRK